MNSGYEQQEMPLLGVIDRPALLDRSKVDACKSYREAVMLCWASRRIRNMTRSTLAERAGCSPSHVGDYIHPVSVTKHGVPKRNLPPACIAGFESACGCACITQWLVSRSGMTLLEEVIKRAA